MINDFNDEAFVIFTTRDYASHKMCSISSASKRLARLKKNALLTHVTKGVWANTRHPYFHPASCVPYLLNNESGYVSFLTALHFHGLLSQIPKTIQIATTGHSRTLNSSVGFYEFIQMKPGLMQEQIIWSETQLPYLLATPEKSLLDVLYISTRKNKRFKSIPELELTPDLINKKIFGKLLKQLPLSSRIVNAMKIRAQVLGVL